MFVSWLLSRLISLLCSAQVLGGSVSLRLPIGGRFVFTSRSKDMNQWQLNREVAKATGESICTIAQRGFSLASWVPSEPGCCAIDGLIDWDYIDATKTTALFLDKQLQHAA